MNTFVTSLIPTMSALIAKKLVKMITSNITLGNQVVTIYDYKPSPHRPDDALYVQHGKLNIDMYHNLPRGLAVFKLGDRQFLLQGVRKFGYIDDPYKWTEEPIKTMYFLTKENGEACHVSAFSYEGELFVAVGSKNVHGLVRWDHFMEDLENYSDVRYGYFKEMATTLYGVLTSSNVDSLGFLNYLVENGCTAVAESCNLQHQHLVKYEENSLRFFALSSPVQHGLTYVNPMEAYELFCSFGLNVVERIESVDVHDEYRLAELNESFQTEENSEGAVVYCTNEDGVVVWMYKHKNNDYVFRRAIREKMRTKASVSQIIERINHLHFIHPRKDELLAYYLRFYAWGMIADLGITWDDVFSQWCSLEERFSHVSDDDKERFFLEFMDKPISKPTIMMMSPCPGLGKTSIAFILSYILGFVRVNQDDYPKKKARKMYLANIKKLLEDESTSGVIFDKTNANKANRDDYGFCRGRITVLSFYHQDDDETIDNLCQHAKERITSRGFSHKTLFPTSQLNGIINSFKERYEPISKEEAEKYNIVPVNVIEPLEEQIEQILDEFVSLKLITGKPSIESIHEAIQHLKDYETSLAIENQKNARTQLWKISFPDEELSIVQSTIAYVVEEWTNTHESVIYTNDKHVTLRFYNTKKDIDKTVEDTLLSLEHSTVEVKITGIAYDNNIVALTVNCNINGQNEHPHITWCFTEGTLPVYSNEMLQNPLVIIPLDITLFGTIERQLTLN